MIGVGELVIVFIVVVIGAVVLSAFLWATFGKKVFLRVAAVVGALLVAFLFLSMLLVPHYSAQQRPQASVSQSISHTHEIHPPSTPPRPEVQEMDFIVDNAVWTPNSVVVEWDENIEDTCETDVYTQGRFAVSALTRKIAGRIRDKAAKDAIVVVTDDTPSTQSPRLQNFHTQMLDSIADELKDEGYTIVSEEPDGVQDGSPIATVELKLDQINGQFAPLAQKPRSHSPVGAPKSAECTAKVSIDGVAWQCSTRFADKLWLSDFDAFQTSQQGERFTLVRSESDLHTSAVEAADNLEDRLNVALYRSFKRFYERSWPTRPLPNSNQFQAAMSSIRDNGNGHILPVVDHFSQSMTINGQNYYRGAALVQDSRMKSIAHEINIRRMVPNFAADEANRSLSFGRILSIIGIFGVVVIGYYAADAATRGYYSPVLAGLCVVIFITMSVVLA